MYGSISLILLIMMAILTIAIKLIVNRVPKHVRSRVRIIGLIGLIVLLLLFFVAVNVQAGV